MAGWTGARKPAWQIQLLDMQDNELGDLDGVTGGSVTISATDTLGGSASLDLDERGQNIDFLTNRVRIVYDPGVSGLDPIPLGVYLFSSPSMEHDAAGIGYKCDLQTKVQILDEDCVPATYTVPKGTKVVDKVVELIKSTGETKVQADASSSVTRVAQTWDAGTSKREIINDLLDGINFWAIYTDGDGFFQVRKYVEPSKRPVSWSFAPGSAAIHSVEWTRTQDLAAIPNRVILTAPCDGENEGLVATATNQNASNPYSYQARGRWISKVEQVDADTQATLDEQAKRKLNEAMTPVASLTATHAIVPLERNQVVEFTSRDLSRRRFTIQKMSFDISFDAQCKAEWREI